jgi:hypothetical protein
VRYEWYNSLPYNSALFSYNVSFLNDKILSEGLEIIKLTVIGLRKREHITVSRDVNNKCTDVGLTSVNKATGDSEERRTHI